MCWLYLGFYLPKTRKIPGMTAIFPVCSLEGVQMWSKFYCNVIKRKWQLKVKLLRSLFDDVTVLRQFTYLGVAAEWHAASSPCYYSLYSAAALATRSSRKGFTAAFGEAETCISALSARRPPCVPHGLALGCVPSGSVLFFVVCNFLT